MKLKTFHCLHSLLWLMALAVQAQPFPVQQGGKWGAVNAQGQVVIPMQYDHLTSFDAQGLALIRRQGKAGLIRQDGTEVIPPQYERLRVLTGGCVAFWQAGRCGLLDLRANVLTAPEYDFIRPLHDTIFTASKGGKLGVIGQSGTRLLIPEFDEISAFDAHPRVAVSRKANQFGLVNAAGQIIAQAEAFTSLTIQGNQAKGLKTKGFAIFELDAAGRLISRQDYQNDTDFQLSNRKKEEARQQQILATQPDARKPRWILNKFKYVLADGAGRNLLSGKEFFELGVEETIGLALGKMEDDKERIVCYVIDTQQAKILFSTTAKDIFLTDFVHASWARISIDTLYDGLTDRNGRILRDIKASDGSSHRLTNIGNFGDGRAWYLSAGKYGYLNTDAQVVVPPIYELAADFQNGYAVVRQNGLFGLIDPQGKTVIPIQYDGVSAVENGLVRTKKGKGTAGRWGVVDLKNQVVIPHQYDLIYEWKNGVAKVRSANKFGLLDTKGKWILQPVVTCEDMGDFVQGVAPIYTGRTIVPSPDGKPKTTYQFVGYVDQKGNTLIPPVYSAIFKFEEAYTARKGLALLIRQGLRGYADHSGKVILPAEYEQIEGLEEAWEKQAGLVRIRKGGLIGYLNHLGQPLLNPAFEEVEDFDKTLGDTLLWAKAKVSGKYGYIDYKGRTMVPFQYEQLSAIRQGRLLARQSGKWGLIDLQNKTLLPFEYDGARFSKAEGLIELLRMGQTAYLMDGDGQVIGPAPATASAKLPAATDKYSFVSDFGPEGVAVVKDKDNRFALISRAGKLLTKFDYVEIGEFSEGLAMFRKDDKDKNQRKCGYLNAQGKEVIAAQYSAAGPLVEGLAAVRPAGQWGYINATGQMVIPARYKDAQPFGGGYAVTDQKQVIDRQGNVVGVFKSAKGKIIRPFTEGRAIAEDEEGQYHIGPDGQPLYPGRFDEVTAYGRQVAFVKKGQVWELVRKKGSEEFRVRFTHSQKLEYLAQFGPKREIKTSDGRKMEDLRWELVESGYWRMTDADGYVIGDVIYRTVERLPDGTFRVVADRSYQVANTDGRLLTEAADLLSPADGLLRVQSAGRTGYLSPAGVWIWPLQK